LQAGKNSVFERKGKDSEGSLKKFAVEGGAVGTLHYSFKMILIFWVDLDLFFIII
jgi:hypothetical protein